MDDEKLSQLFRDARRADEARVPGFERVLSRTRTPRLGVKPLVSFALAAVVLIAGATAVVRERQQREEQALAELEKPVALMQWQSPTDFLLDTPGHELRDSLPQIGMHVPTNVQAAKPQGEKQ